MKYEPKDGRSERGKEKGNNNNALTMKGRHYRRDEGKQKEKTEDEINYARE